MRVTPIKITITKQDWDNFTYYCENTNITKLKAISIILNDWLEKYGVYHNIDEDFEIDVSNYNHKQFDFKQDYSSGLLHKSIKVYEFLWKTYTDFCNANGYITQSLLNVIINTFLYPDFPSIEMSENEKQEEDFKYVYNEDGSLKYKTNKNIKGNQA